MKNDDKHKKISGAVSLQARGLFTLAHGYYQKYAEAERALADLLGYDTAYGGRLSDEMAGDGDFDAAMRKEGFVVVKQPKKRR